MTSAAFGTKGWNYNNAKDWKGNFLLLNLDLIVTCGGSHQSPINIITSKASEEENEPFIYYRVKSEEIAYEEANSIILYVNI